MTQYGKSYLFEDQASSNRSKARRYMRKESGMTEDESMELDQELRVRFDNANKCDCKFLLGLARMYMNGELDDNSTAQSVNQALGIATEEPYASKLDRDLNGMTAQEFLNTFQDEVESAGDADKENLSKQDFGGNNGYDIVLIDSFELAEEYAQYTTWCITQSQVAYDNYTKGGTFYFCLKDDFEDIPKEVSVNAPLDEYGLSMIAVSIYPDGKCNTITCRWNHEQGDDDHVMTTEELSKVIGENFYDVFKPIKRTININGEECFIGTTEDGMTILYDSQGNNALGDDINNVSADSALSNALGGEVLKVHSKNGGYNYLISKDGKTHYLFNEWFERCLYVYDLSEPLDALCFLVSQNNRDNILLFINGTPQPVFDEWLYWCQIDVNIKRQFGITLFRVYNNNKSNYIGCRNGKLQYLFKEWLDSCTYEDDFCKMVGAPFFKVKKDNKYNYVIYQDGTMQYLIDKWVDNCWFSYNLSEQLGCPCFQVEEDDYCNIVIYKEGVSKYLFYELLDYCIYEHKWSKMFGFPCFSIEKKGKVKFAMYKDGKIQYLPNKWVTWNDLGSIVGDYAKQRNEGRFRLITNIITEMIISKLR